MSTPLFRIALGLLGIVSVLWAFSLIWLMNPFLASCEVGSGGAPYANASGATCYQATADGGVQVVRDCRSWSATSDAMGSVLGWVGELQTVQLFPTRYTISGERQTCFAIPSTGVERCRMGL